MSRKGRSKNRATTPEPVAPVRRAPVPLQKFFVRLENLTAQTLVVSVTNRNGAPESLRLAPRGKSRPIEANRVGSFTHDLVQRGRVRILQVNG